MDIPTDGLDQDLNNFWKKNDNKSKKRLDFDINWNHQRKGSQSVLIGTPQMSQDKF